MVGVAPCTDDTVLDQEYSQQQTKKKKKLNLFKFKLIKLNNKAK